MKMIWWINFFSMLTFTPNLWCLGFAVSLPFADGNSKEFAVCRQQMKTRQNDQYRLQLYHFIAMAAAVAASMEQKIVKLKLEDTQ